jgi:ATP-dependent Clp protease ATP-binding subunit ClpA
VEEGLAARVLESLGVTAEEVRFHLARIVGHGGAFTTGQMPLTPGATKVLEWSLDEAIALDHDDIGTEHLLLALAREKETVAMRILLELGADAEKIRGETIGMLTGPGRRERAPRSQDAQPSALPPELESAIERVRGAKESALAERDFERAAAIRDRERALIAAARTDAERFRELAERPLPKRSPLPPWSGPGTREHLLGWSLSRCSCSSRSGSASSSAG